MSHHALSVGTRREGGLLLVKRKSGTVTSLSTDGGQTEQTWHWLVSGGEPGEAHDRLRLTAGAGARGSLRAVAELMQLSHTKPSRDT